MMKSAKAKKQRLHRATAPLHERQHFVHSHIDKSLKQKLGIKARAVRIRKVASCIVRLAIPSAYTVQLYASLIPESYRTGCSVRRSPLRAVLRCERLVGIDQKLRPEASWARRGIPLRALRGASPDPLQVTPVPLDGPRCIYHSAAGFARNQARTRWACSLGGKMG